MEYKILIVEDDTSISNLLKEHIKKYNFDCKIIDDFENVMDEFNTFKPHLVLLDINLPKFDGYYWCRKIRQESNLPIIFISARENQMDQVMALENGADDYITKPFYYEVVMAKIKSHIRRSYGEYSSSSDERIVELDKLKFFPERLEVTFNEKTIVLTKKEGILLECLITNYQKAVSRDYLLEKLWDDIAFVEENTLNVNVTRLRKKLQELTNEYIIETVRSLGYKLTKV